LQVAVAALVAIHLTVILVAVVALVDTFQQLLL
jgi:hypothetical protein